MIVTCLHLMAVLVSVETARDTRLPTTAINPSYHDLCGLIVHHTVNIFMPEQWLFHAYLQHMQQIIGVC